MTDDLFDSPGDDAYGLTPNQQRYRFPHPITGKVQTFRRCTNLVKAFSDQYRLQLWLERMTLLGLLESEGLLFDELAAMDFSTFTEDRLHTFLRDFAEKCRQAVGADAGARRGTARHLMVENFLSGGYVTGHRRMRLQLESLQEAMDKHHLDFVPNSSETTVWHPAGGGTIGRLDVKVMCRRTGQVGILDLKTQAQFWTYQEICGQQAIYDSAPYCWEGPLSAEGSWKMWTRANDLTGHPDGLFPGKRVALLAHMAQKPGPGQLPVELHEVDLEYGARVVEQAERIVELRSIGASTADSRRVGGLRPL